MKGHPLHDLWAMTFATIFGVAIYEIIAHDVTASRRLFLFAIAAAGAGLWYANRRLAGPDREP